MSAPTLFRSRGATAQALRPLRPRTKVCDQCGHVRIAKPGSIQEDGQLVKLGSRAKASVVPTSADKAQFHAELRWYARERGIKSGFVWHKFRERFGLAATGFEWTEPEPPSFKTQNWIRSRQIAYLKGSCPGWLCRSAEQGAREARFR
jgi:DNA repair protein RadD